MTTAGNRSSFAEQQSILRGRSLEVATLEYRGDRQHCEADPAAGLVLAVYSVREVGHLLGSRSGGSGVA
jgi:hypothetical protein